MPKVYMIRAQRAPADPDKSSAYRELANPALEKHGGKYLDGGGRVVAKENGIAERTILIEFESFEAAVAAFESDDYQAALKVLDGGANRDIRVFEGT